MHISAAEFFRGHFFTRGCFDQRRATKKNGALAFDNNVLIRHGRHIRSTSRA